MHSSDINSRESEFLSSLSKDQRVAISNRNPDLYEDIITAKAAGIINLKFHYAEQSQSKFDIGKLLWNLEIADLERLAESVKCTIRADQTATDDMPKAVELYHRAMELNPFDDVATMSYGVALGRQGDLREGIKWVEHAIELNPANERAQRSLAALKSYL